MLGAVPNEGGYSFWLTNEPVTIDAPFTVIAQIRFINRVDYGGAGVALIDPNATSEAQKNVRIELSERDDTAGVGGWLPQADEGQEAREPRALDPELEARALVAISRSRPCRGTRS